MQGAATATFVGREAELAAVERFLDRAPAGPYALFIEGEAGIGKTTVWLEAVRARRGKGTPRAQGAAGGERGESLVRRARRPRRRSVRRDCEASCRRSRSDALAAALLRATADESAPAGRRPPRSSACSRRVAEREPVLVALDDVQWLDPASEQALAFAVRRLPPQLSLLVARRAEPGGELPLGLARALPEDRVERVAPAPLSFAALHELVKSRVGLSLSRPLLGQLAEASGGNPFFALEMARAYASRPAERDPGEPLPVPRSLEELVAAHVGRLSEDSRQVALAAASGFAPDDGAPRRCARR